jgi:SAM-dependent methyltransferase
MAYTDDWHDLIDLGARRSASVVLPVVYELVAPESAIDVGCGRGAWGAALASLGCNVVGVERDAATVTSPGVEPVGFDLSQLAHAPGPSLGSFDLALCLEVGEHLPEECAPGLVDWLCSLAPTVLFSAATPGQGGEGHINEQWPDYWADRFEANAFDVSGALRWSFWSDQRVDPWYSQNLLVAMTRTDRLDEDVRNVAGYEWFGPHAFSEPLPVVHPRIAAAMLAARP